MPMATEMLRARPRVQTGFDLSLLEQSAPLLPALPHHWGPCYLDLLEMGLSSKSHSCVGGGTAANWQSNMASSFLVTMRSWGAITA